ncbi:cysteine proteinase, partial [Dendrothele bispora CBS 962.96]
RRSSRRREASRKVTPQIDLDEVILSYPPATGGSVNITNADLSRLDPDEYLNDTLIEFGLRLWHRELEETNPELAGQVHIFNSFFYKKLMAKKSLEENYQSVSRWTSKIDLFKKKFIIVPINEASVFTPQENLLLTKFPVCIGILPSSTDRIKFYSRLLRNLLSHPESHVSPMQTRLLSLETTTHRKYKMSKQLSK